MRARIAVTSSGATITPFSRSGVDYVEILFTASGSFTVGRSVPWHSRALGGGGGAGGAGGDASSGVAGAAGSGVLLDWIATPRTVCAGAAGLVGVASAASTDATWGSGSKGAINATVGKGGDGFLFLVVRADQVNVVLA